MRRNVPRLAAAFALAALGLWLSASGAWAHPMGNFSINQYTAISVGPGSVRVLYIVDLAEIPTFQELSSLGDTSGTDLRGAPRGAYLRREAASLTSGLKFTFAGRPVLSTIKAADLLFPPGAGGLSTERIYLVIAGKLPRTAGALGYADTNFAGRAGWKEIVATAHGGARIGQASVPSSDRSRTLTIYPSTLTSSPPQDDSATLNVAAGPLGSESVSVREASALISDAESPLLNANGSWSDLARGLARTQARSAGTSFAASRNDPLSGLMGHHDLSVGVLLLSLIVAFWFGAGHALSPGHGKTIVAAYLVGSRGTAGQAALLGLTVTATHTAGVFALGLVTLYLSRYILPDQLYPILGFISGLLVALMGVTLFARRLRTRLGERRQPIHTEHTVHALNPSRERLHVQGIGHSHEHAHPLVLAGAFAGGAELAMARPIHTHGHADLPTHEIHHRHDRAEEDGHIHRHGIFGRSHSHGPLTPGSNEKPSLKSLLALGVSGGLLPCPSALVVLLSAIAFHRVAFGMMLIVAFSFGLATVLTGIGIAVVYSGRILGRLKPRGRVRRYVPAARNAIQIMPLFSACAVAFLGSLIALGALSPGLLPSFLPKL